MPTNRITMRQIRETLRLHLQAGLSYNEVGRALKISKSAVGKYVSLARVAGVDWAAAQTLTDDELEARLYRPPLPRSSYQLTPDFAAVHQELKRPGVTLQLLWEEYAAALIGQGGLAYKYTSFCVKYRAWAQSLKRSMRQSHLAGEKLFVDYAGQTVPLVDAITGEITVAQIFVATLGASNYTYACATLRQTTADWIGAQIRALEFFGGVPRLIVPDQTRALIKHPDRYDPQPNALYDEFAAHYGCALLAARPAHPRDKPKVENAVLVVERWILARLRNRRFFSLAELNKAIAGLLVDLNQRPFKKLPGCRRSAFEALDAPALQPLPPHRFELFSWKTAKVHVDYHVEFEGHYYRWHGRPAYRPPGTPPLSLCPDERQIGRRSIDLEAHHVTRFSVASSRPGHRQEGVSTSQRGCPIRGDSEAPAQTGQGVRVLCQSGAEHRCD